MNKLLHNNTLFTLTLLGIATALAFLFFSFVSENTANIALLYFPDAGSTKPVNQGFKGVGNQK